MPINVSWMYPSRVVFVRFYGIVLFQDVQEQFRETQRCIDEGAAPVHFFIDTADVEKYDLSLMQIRSLFPPQDPKIGWTVVYGQSKVTQFFASILMQLVKGKFQFVESKDEALTFIAHQDATLAELRSASLQE
jgi:hypothetical protein